MRSLVVGLLYGWGVAVPLGVAMIVLRLWWQLGLFWTREQRSRIRRRAQQIAGNRQVSAVSKVTMLPALQLLLGVGVVAALWWAVRSGEPAGWAIFFCLCSINISVSTLASRAARRKRSTGAA